jgi:hypothetical protein
VSCQLCYTSRFRTSSAFSSINFRRLSTSSPISVEKMFSVSARSCKIHLQQRARLGAHGCRPQLIRVHFAQPFVALYGNLARAFALDMLQQFALVGQRFRLGFLRPSEWSLIVLGDLARDGP